MSNLYDRLKLEHLEAIVSQRSKYPNLVEGIERKLKAEVSWLHLSYGDCSDICSLTNSEIKNIPFLFDE